jgi:hypothetical protein
MAEQVGHAFSPHQVKVAGTGKELVGRATSASG